MMEMRESFESSSSGSGSGSGRPGRQLKRSDMQQGGNELKKPNGGGPKNGQWSFPTFQPPET